VKLPPGNAGGFKSSVVGGPCRNCGQNLVEFERLGERDLGDVAYTFGSLKRELIRHTFWHRPFDLRAVNHALRKGRALLAVAAISRVQKSVAVADNPLDGRQTPFSGNTLYYAQHAVAACCRKCIEYWHRIPAGRPLSSEEVDYLAKLMMLYIQERLPDLPESPTKVAPIRKKRQS
jgi:hypothetical protein